MFKGTHDNHAFVHMKNGATDFTGFNIGQIRGLNMNNGYPIIQSGQIPFIAAQLSDLS